MIRKQKPRLRSSGGSGAQRNAPWYLAGLKALEFLERSRDMAAEPVIATPLLLPSRVTRS